MIFACHRKARQRFPPSWTCKDVRQIFMTPDYETASVELVKMIGLPAHLILSGADREHIGNVGKRD